MAKAVRLEKPITEPTEVAKMPGQAFRGGTHPSTQAEIPQITLAPMSLRKMIASGEISRAAILVKGTVRLKRMMHKVAARMFMAQQ